MTPNKPQGKETAFPQLLELPWWAYAIIAVIALAVTSILHYLNAAKFPLTGTSAAVVVYLATAWSLSAALSRFSGDSDTGFMQSELGGGALLVLIGVIAGGFGGAIWWLSVGPEVATLGQAIAGGALLGGLVIGFLLGGA
jgi:hypothetical protein